MRKILIALIAVILVGCGGTRFSQTPPSHIPITRTVSLNIAKIWPLQTKGTYLQKITASVRGQQQTFSVHLTLDDRMLEAIAFNDIAGRLYKLKWTPRNVEWQGSAFIPSIIKPENILADFLLAQLSANQLQRVLKGAQVFENGDANGKMRVIKDRNVLRVITFQGPIGGMPAIPVKKLNEPQNGAKDGSPGLGNPDRGEAALGLTGIAGGMWENVTIENPLYGYKLHIQTAAQ